MIQGHPPLRDMSLSRRRLLQVRQVPAPGSAPILLDTTKGFPGHSARSLSRRDSSFFSFGIVTVNGITGTLRQIPRSVAGIRGLWFVKSTSFAVGWKEKGFP